MGILAVIAVLAVATLGITLNLTSGRQQQSQSRSTALPTAAVPMFKLRVPLERFVFVAEGMPPIGPISYNGGNEATKLSYLSGEFRWRTADDRLEIGVGTTLVNQLTEYPRFVVTPEQSSRVAGLRIGARMQLENDLRGQTYLRVSASPSMHGLQVTKHLLYAICHGFPAGPVTCTDVYAHVNDAELASLVDAEVARTQHTGRFEFSYGIRYVNYAARFTKWGLQADRERLLMPFAGLVLPLGR